MFRAARSPVASDKASVAFSRPTSIGVGLGGGHAGLLWTPHGAPSRPRHPQRRCGSLSVTCASQNNPNQGASGSQSGPFPFSHRDYFKCSLHYVQATHRPGGMHGTLILLRADAEANQAPGERAMVLSVGGDTLMCITSVLQHQDLGRPMALDLLIEVLNRGKAISKRDWTLLHVAVVELRGSTFIGRLFFGDPATGQVYYDVDCRPSDATWLSIKTQAPLFVHKKVWEEASVPMEDALPQGGAQADAAPPSPFAAGGAGDTGYGPSVPLSGGSGGSSSPAAAGSGSYPRTEAPGAFFPTAPGVRFGDPMVAIKDSDPEPIKRLKRELGVAVRDEDYSQAARIRDHPYMRQYRRIVAQREEGLEVEAGRMEAELMKQIQRDEANSPRGQGQGQGQQLF